MKRRTFLGLVPFPITLLQAQSMTNEEVRKHLAAMRVAQRGHMNVDPPEGEFFYNLVKRMNARRVLEIGTSNGYSALWFAMGLRETGGRLVTIELDKGRFDLAQANFTVTGLAPVIEARLVDAKLEAGRVQGPFDIVLIDAWKPDYVSYYEAVLPNVRKGGVILAHNVVNTRAFLDRVQSDPAVRTEILTLGTPSLSASTKL
jgi:predicted O-methyltransferase YrrM